MRLAESMVPSKNSDGAVRVQRAKVEAGIFNRVAARGTLSTLSRGRRVRNAPRRACGTVCRGRSRMPCLSVETEGARDGCERDRVEEDAIGK